MNKPSCLLHFIPLLIMLILLLAGCAANKTAVSKAELLDREISRWQSFHMEGLAEINVFSFALRKYFICQKKSHSLQLDLVNTGLAGAEPTPLASIMVDSLLTIQSPYKDMIQAMFHRSGLKNMNLSAYLDFQQLLADKKPEIISTGKTTLANYEFKFNKRMQLIQVSSKDKNQIITIEYRKNEPSLIMADIQKLGLVRMQVEQFIETSCCDEFIEKQEDNR